MTFVKRHSSSIILSLFEILVGILLLINPIQFTSGIIIAFGVVLVIVGLISIISYFREDPLEASTSQSLAKGLLALCAGLFCMFKSGWFVNTFPLLTIVYGIFIFIGGILKVQWTVDTLRMRTGGWLLPALSAVISLLCAVVILSNPFDSTVILWMFTGGTLVVESLLDIIAMIFGGKKSGEI